MHVQCVSAVSCYLCSRHLDLYAVTPVQRTVTGYMTTPVSFWVVPPIHIPRIKFQTITYSNIVISKVNLSDQTPKVLLFV